MMLCSIRSAVVTTGRIPTRTGSVRMPSARRGDLRRDRGREEQRLAPRRQRPDHASDVVDEAHVEHPVGLVEDEHLEPVEADEALAHEVEQAAGGGDQDVDARRHRPDLRVLADAAEDHGAAQLQVAAVDGEAGLDLSRELAGRGQHEGAAGLGPGPARIAGEALQDRQREGGGLAGAGLGAAQEVAAREQMRDRLDLDRRRRGVVLGAHGALDRLDQPELGKGSQGSGLFRYGPRVGMRPALVGSGHPARGRGGLSVHCSRDAAAGGIALGFARSRAVGRLAPWP